MLIKSLKFVFKPTFNWWEVAFLSAIGNMLFGGQILFAILLIFFVVIVNWFIVKCLEAYDEVINESK